MSSINQIFEFRDFSKIDKPLPSPNVQRGYRSLNKTVAISSRLGKVNENIPSTPVSHPFKTSGPIVSEKGSSLIISSVAKKCFESPSDQATAKEAIKNEEKPQGEIPSVAGTKKPQNILEEQTPKAQPRRYPPISIKDTVIFVDDKVESIHGQADFFSDSEIMKIHQVVRTMPLGQGVNAEYTDKEKTIIQQQAVRGCTAAVTAMLIMDNGKKCDLEALFMRNLGDNATQAQDIYKAGLVPMETLISGNLDDLQSAIRKNGSAIVPIRDEKLMQHVIIVDEVTDTNVRLRDPYHGWEISVKREALSKRFRGGVIMQIQAPFRK